MTQCFNGKTVFITGVTRGIGKAIATAFHSSGARVFGSGTKERDQDCFYGYVNSDFNDLAQISACADYVRNIEPDILINNAGVNNNSSFVDIDPRDFLRIQQVNVFAPFMLCKAVIPSMCNKGWGRIINISSIWGKISKEHRAAYSASKFALDGMTIALAAELSKYGILANCVAPGFTDTDLTRRSLGDAGILEIAKCLPIGRMATTDEIAKFIVWLASSENTYITGQNIAIDGGFTRV